MADIQANIGIGVDTSQALASIRQLQREISVFHTLMAKGGADAAAKSRQMQQGLVNTINETGRFSAGMTRISSSTESFTNALEKNKLSMGQYFRYAGGASKSFGKMFSREFNTINRVATERVKDLQTQYISMGRDANGALQSIKVRPLALDMDNLGTKVQLAAQKQQVFNQLMKQGTTNLLNFGKNTQWAGRQLMVGFTIPLTIFGATAAREFQKLEEQAVRFRRVYGDMFTTDADTEKALANVRQLAEEFTKYGIAVEKTVGLAAKVAQMGNVGEDLTAQVTQATRLAVLGGLEQEQALDTTISLTNAFGIAAEDLAGKIAFLNAAENQTILSIEDFNEAIPKAGSVVQQLGGDVEDLAFFLTAMREGGINASQGANALKTSLARLVAPTEVAKKEMAAFGIDIVGIVEKNAGNLRETVVALGQELDGLDALNRARAIEQLFGKFQFARMSTMFQNISKEGSQASKILELTTNSMEELQIVAERELKAVEDSPAFRLKKQMEELKAALAPIGEEFIKAVGPLIEFGTKLLKSFNNLGDGSKQFIVVLTAIAGVVAPALLMGFGLIANGVANLIKFIKFLSDTFGMLSGRSALLGGQTEYMTQQQIEAAAVAASLGQSHSNLTQIFTSEASAISNLVAQYRAAIQAQRQLSIGQTAAGVARMPMGPRPRGFAAGGIIRGPGTGTSDSIMAMISNGEAVIPAAVVKENPEAIKQLIAGNMPGYNGGGIVGTNQTKGYTDYVAKFSPQLNSGSLSREQALAELQGGGEAIYSPIIYKIAQELGATTPNEVRAMVEAEGSPLKKFAGDLKRGIIEGVQAGAEDVNPNDEEIYGIVDNIRPTEEAGYSPEFIAAEERARTTVTTVENTAEKRVNERGKVRTAGRQKLAEEGNFYKGGERRFSKIEDLLEGTVPEKTELSHLTGYSVGTPEEFIGERTLTDPSQRLQTALDSGSGTLYHEPSGQRLSAPLGPITKSEAANIIATAETQGAEDANGYMNAAEAAVAQQAPSFLPNLLDAGGWNSPHPTWVSQGAEDGEGYQDAFEAAASGTGKPPLPGNLAAPKPPVQPAAAQPGRFGKLFSSAKDKINESKIAQKAADYLGGKDLDDKITIGPGMSNEEREAHRTAKSINQDLFDKGLITEDMQATPLGQTQGVTPVRVVDGQLDIGDNSIDQLADASPAANDAAERNELTRREIRDNRVAQEEATEATQGLAKSQEQQANEDKAARKEQKRQNRQARAGKALGALGTATMVAGMATQVEGKVGEVAQKALPALAGLSAVAPLLMALPLPLAALVAVVGLVAGGLYFMHQKMKEAREAAAKLAESLSSGKKAMDGFAEYAGTATPSEIMRARVEKGFSPVTTAPGKSDFGQGFLQSDPGKTIVESMTKGFEEFGKRDTIKKIANQLGTAVAGGILTQDQANKIAVALGTEFEDFSISTNIIGNLNELLGPNGENLLEDPLQISMNLLEDSAEDIFGASGSLQKYFARVAGEVSDGWYSGIIATEELEGRLAGDLLGFFEARQATLDTFDVNAGERISALREEAKALRDAGKEEEARAKFAEARDLESQSYTDRAALVEQGAALTADLFKQFADAQAMLDQAQEDYNEATETDFMASDEELEEARKKVNAFNEALVTMQGIIKQRFEGTEQADDIERIFKGLNQRNNLGKNVIDYETRMTFSAAIGTGAFSTSFVEDFFENFDPEEDSQAYDMLVDLVIKYGQGAGTQVSNVLDTLTGAYGDDLEKEKEVKTSFLTTLSGINDPEDFQRTADAFSTLAQYDGLQGINIGAVIEFYDNSPEALESFRDSMSKMQEIVDSGEPITIETLVEQNVIRDEVAVAMAKEDAEYFEQLDPMQQFLYVQTFLSVFETIGDDQSEAWLRSQGIVPEGTRTRIFGLMGTGASAEVPVYTEEQLLAGQTGAALDFAESVTQIQQSVQDANDAAEDLENTGSKVSGVFDNILKKLRDTREGALKAASGWEAVNAALNKIFGGGAENLQFNGLEKQIRNLNVGEGLIAQIVGMDPDEYEKRKHELFEFNNAGNIVGAKQKLLNLNKAFDAVAIGEYVNGQEKFITKTNNQISAISTLTANGMSLADAYEAVQDAALASAIAQGASTEEIKEILRVTELAKELEKDLEAEREKSRISESVRKTNEEFSNQVAILKQLSKEQGKYSDEQVKAIMGDSDLQKLYLDPTIDEDALEAALQNAAEKANLEVQIAIAEGREEELFGQYLTDINDYFSKEQAVIDVTFEADTAADNDLIRDAQNQIAAIQYQLDDYNAELERISWQEEDINEKYDKRAEALDNVAKANERINNLQKAQLDIAEALSRGDVAGAARAQQELRAQQAKAAEEAQKEALERQRTQEIEAVRSTSGLGREEIEDLITTLERQVFEIEEGAIEPAQERVRLAEITRDIAIEQLELNGMAREEFDAIAAATSLAAINMEDMATSAEKLVAMGQFIQTGTKPANWEELFPMPKAAPAPAPSSGGGGSSAPRANRKDEWTMPDGTPLKNLVPAGMSWNQYYNENRGGPNGLDQKLSPTYSANGGMIVPKRMAVGGMVGGVSGPPLQMAMGGKVKGYPMGGLIPYKSNGGFFKSLGSDTVPAMLTPGEYVVRRPAVKNFGVKNLEDINRGTYSDGSVYNYNLNVNVKSDSDPNRIANTVMRSIKQVEGQRIRGNRI